jgi:hypothetical protein
LTGLSVQERKVLELAPRPALPQRWPVVAAGLLALLGGAYGGIEYMRWQPTDAVSTQINLPASGVAQADFDGQRGRQEDASALARGQAELEAERRRQDEASAAANRQAELEAERRRQEEAAAQRRSELEAERQREAEEERVAAVEAQRQRDEERARVASATLNADARATFVRRVQQLLKQGGCYDGAMNGRNETTQGALDEFVAMAARKGKVKPARIELARATAGDFEAWLREAGEVKGEVCTPSPPPRPKVARPAREREEPQQRRRVEHSLSPPREREPPSSGTKLCWGYRNELAPCH